MLEANQGEPGYSKKMVWIIILLIIVAGVGLVIAIWPKKPLGEVLYPKNPGVNGSSNDTVNTASNNDQPATGNGQETGGNNTTGGNNPGGNVPPIHPIRTTTPTSTTNPTDNPGGSFNPDTSTTSPTAPNDNTAPGNVNPNTVATTTNPADNPTGGIRQ